MKYSAALLLGAATFALAAPAPTPDDYPTSSGPRCPSDGNNYLCTSQCGQGLRLTEPRIGDIFNDWLETSADLVGQPGQSKQVGCAGGTGVFIDMPPAGQGQSTNNVPFTVDQIVSQIKFTFADCMQHNCCGGGDKSFQPGFQYVAADRSYNITLHGSVDCSKTDTYS